MGQISGKLWYLSIVKVPQSHVTDNSDLDLPSLITNHSWKKSLNPQTAKERILILEHCVFSSGSCSCFTSQKFTCNTQYCTIFHHIVPYGRTHLHLLYFITKHCVSFLNIYDMVHYFEISHNVVRRATTLCNDVKKNWAIWRIFLHHLI